MDSAFFLSAVCNKNNFLDGILLHFFLVFSAKTCYTLFNKRISVGRIIDAEGAGQEGSR